MPPSWIPDNGKHLYEDVYLPYEKYDLNEDRKDYSFEEGRTFI